MSRIYLKILILIVFYSAGLFRAHSTDISDNTFLIAEITGQNYNNQRLWDLLAADNNVGLQLNVEMKNDKFFLRGSTVYFENILIKISYLLQEDASKVIPVFLQYDDDVFLLDSIINNLNLASSIFYLPQGETWPSTEYLVQSNRRIIFFIEGEYKNESRILHVLKNYALRISANKSNELSNILNNNINVNLELFAIENFEKLSTYIPPSQNDRNLVPDYVNYLLENWKMYGKKPNFIFVGKDIFNYDFIVDQLNSFTWIKGNIKVSGKNLEKVYWKNPDVLITGGNFSFPYRGGEEITLSPFAPGYSMTPEHVVVTGEMSVPESYSIIASPLELGENMTCSFNFDGILLNTLQPEQTFQGENFSFSQDIDRGTVLRLPENANINLGNPEIYGLRNSSFTVGCFVKFTEILDFGDNAILGNLESGYRRGLHLILRSGYPYFGLWANDFMSDEKLKPNVWYHLAWRYIIETGEESIFLNGKLIGSSDGHPPYSGTGDIHLGSALSSGASLRGYIDNFRIWNRPLGNEEINRLFLDEEIKIPKKVTPEKTGPNFSKGRIIIVAGLFILVMIPVLIIVLKRKRKWTNNIEIPEVSATNKILLFGEFKAVNKDGKNVSDQFTPKVKELFIFCLIHTLKNGIGAGISEISEVVWEGISDKKAANNRSVTLNKLRKLLLQFDEIEIVSNTGHLQVKTNHSFFCDYAEAFKLCQIPEGMTKQQLVAFFHLVKRGRFMKGTVWPWLDDIRGFTGNQVIDNLLKLASMYKKEGNLQEIEKVAQRILDYDDLNEEAIYLQVWAQQKAGNSNLAKYSFNSFTKKYESTMGESYPMVFSQFTHHFESLL